MTNPQFDAGPPSHVPPPPAPAQPPGFSPPGQPFYGAPFHPPPPPPTGPPVRWSRKRTVLALAVALVAVAVVAGIASRVGGGSDGVKDQGKYTLGQAVPFGTFAPLADDKSQVSQVELDADMANQALLKSGGSVAVEIFSRKDSDEPAFYYEGLDKVNSKYPGSDPTSTLHKSLATADVVEPTMEPTGPLGGVLECGTPTSSSNPVCGWADGSTLVLVSFQAATAQAAQTTLALRTMLEH